VLTAMTPLSLAADQTSQPPYPTKAFTPRTAKRISRQR